jgi:hypothetical protein
MNMKKRPDRKASRRPLVLHPKSTYPRQPTRKQIREASIPPLAVLAATIVYSLPKEEHFADYRLTPVVWLDGHTMPRLRALARWGIHRDDTRRAFWQWICEDPHVWVLCYRRPEPFEAGFSIAFNLPKHFPILDAISLSGELHLLTDLPPDWLVEQLATVPEPSWNELLQSAKDHEIAVQFPHVLSYELERALDLWHE